jgi:hypothetical protein
MPTATAGIRPRRPSAAARVPGLVPLDVKGNAPDDGDEEGGCCLDRVHEVPTSESIVLMSRPPDVGPRPCEMPVRVEFPPSDHAVDLHGITEISVARGPIGVGPIPSRRVAPAWSLRLNPATLSRGPEFGVSRERAKWPRQRPRLQTNCFLPLASVCRSCSGSGREVSWRERSPRPLRPCADSAAVSGRPGAYETCPPQTS